MEHPAAIDAAWRAAHPLPCHDGGTDKNARGRVLLVGGTEFVPGALRLTAEAALRAGAGKLQMATVESAALLLGMLVPEAATIALPSGNGGTIAPQASELLERAIERCDCAIIGPGTHRDAGFARCIADLLDRPRAGLSILLDAGALVSLPAFAEKLARHEGRVVLTPHHGEMAAMTGLSQEEVAADPETAGRDLARRTGAAVVLKSSRTVILAPDGRALAFESDCPGLATGGSGDVLAGIVGGLVARGAEPVVAAGWGVWLHAQAGLAMTAGMGAVGFLARDLLGEIPRLMVSGSGSRG